MDSSGAVPCRPLPAICLPCGLAIMLGLYALLRRVPAMCYLAPGQKKAQPVGGSCP